MSRRPGRSRLSSARARPHRAVTTWRAVGIGRVLLAAGLALVPRVSWSQAASAAAPESRNRVVLLDRPDADEVGLELAARVRGELRAAGFEVIVLAMPDNADPGAATQTTARELRPAAVLVVHTAIDDATGEPAAELWISDRLLQRTFRQRVLLRRADLSRSIAEFAVQVGELLRGRLAELSVTGAAPAEEAAPSSAAATPSEAPQGPRSVRATVGAGVGMLRDLGGSEQAFLPLLRIGLGFSPHATKPLGFELRGTFSGLGSTVSVSEGAASAELDQALGLLELLARFDTGSPLHPLLSLAGGAYTVRAEGSAPEGYETRVARTWSGVGAAGIGLAYVPAPWFSCSLEFQALTASSETVVQLQGDAVSTLGGAMGLITLALAGLF